MLLSEVRAHLRGRVVVDEPAERDAQRVRQLTREAFGTIREVTYADSDFDDWIVRSEYETISPTWWKTFEEHRERKLLEHYASIELVGFKEGGVYMDVAASGSPFYVSVKKTHKVARCYRQDLNLPEGVNGSAIGSDASAIPLPDQCLHGIVTHNAWEHFEGDSALGFIKECVRLLKTGGKFCIIPLGLSLRTEAWTDPEWWQGKYKNAPDMPEFDPRAAIVIKNGMGQRQVMWYTPADLKADLDSIPHLSTEIVITRVKNMIYFALVGTRTR